MANAPCNAPWTHPGHWWQPGEGPEIVWCDPARHQARVSRETSVIGTDATEQGTTTVWGHVKDGILHVEGTRFDPEGLEKALREAWRPIHTGYQPFQGVPEGENMPQEPQKRPPEPRNPLARYPKATSTLLCALTGILASLATLWITR